MAPLQRRYSVTGQNPPDDVGAMKSPKLQALDTSVQSTSCGLCEGSGGDSARTSSKRSATQIPSPNSPSSQELPPKIARLGLDHDDSMELAFSDDEGSLSDPLPDTDASSDWALSSFHSLVTTIPSSPICPHNLVPLDTCVASDELDEYPQSCSEDLALSPLPHDPAELPLNLLTMPPEIRHQIYLHDPDLIKPYPLIYCLSTFANKKQHPLAAVSRQIRAEALAIFYSYNHWIIKCEFKDMYDSFQNWIVQLGDNAGHLRTVTIAVRGSLFKPKTSHSTSTTYLNGVLVNMNMNMVPGVIAPVEEYHPPDGDASFQIDLSEKFMGGKVVLVRNDGTKEAGEKARLYLSKLVEGLWEKRRLGVLNGQDWVNLVDTFLQFAGWW